MKRKNITISLNAEEMKMYEELMQRMYLTNDVYSHLSESQKMKLVISYALKFAEKEEEKRAENIGEKVP